MTHTVNLAFVDRIDSINFVNRFNAYAAIAKSTNVEEIKKINLYHVADTHQLVISATDSFRLSTSTFSVVTRGDDFSFNYYLEPEKLPTFLERYGNMTITVKDDGTVNFDYGQTGGMIIELKNTDTGKCFTASVTRKILKKTDIVSGKLDVCDELHFFNIDYLIDALKKMKQKTHEKYGRQYIGMYFDTSNATKNTKPAFFPLILINSAGEQVDYILPIAAASEDNGLYDKNRVGILKEPVNN